MVAVAALRELASGEVDEIGVACCVYKALCLQLRQTGLVGDGDGAEPAVLDPAGADDAVIQQRASAFQQHLFRADLYPFRVDHRNGVHMSAAGQDVRQRGLLGLHPLHQLLADAADHLNAISVEEIQKRKSGGCAAADKGVLFDQKGLCAVSGGGDRRGNAGRAASADDHVICFCLHLRAPHHSATVPSLSRQIGLCQLWPSFAISRTCSSST